MLNRPCSWLKPSLIQFHSLHFHLIPLEGGLGIVCHPSRLFVLKQGPVFYDDPSGTWFLTTREARELVRMLSVSKRIIHPSTHPPNMQPSGIYLVWDVLYTPGSLGPGASILEWEELLGDMVGAKCFSWTCSSHLQQATGDYVTDQVIYACRRQVQCPEHRAGGSCNSSCQLAAPQLCTLSHLRGDSWIRLFN